MKPEIIDGFLKIASKTAKEEAMNYLQRLDADDAIFRDVLLEKYFKEKAFKGFISSKIVYYISILSGWLTTVAISVWQFT